MPEQQKSFWFFFFRKRTSFLVLTLPWSWTLLFLAIPALLVLKIAISHPADGVPPFAPVWSWSQGWQGTTDAFALVLGDPFYRDALWRSLAMAAITTVACLLIGYPLAMAIAAAPPNRQRLLLGLVMLPFWTGFLLRVTAWIGLLQDGGIVARLLAFGGAPPQLLYTWVSLYVGLVYAYLPFMVLPLYGVLSRRDPVLAEAAADLGAPPWRVFLRVTLPLSVPGMLAGMALVFIPAVGEYVIPDLLGGPAAATIGRVLWDEFFANHDWPTASAIAVMLLLLLVLLPASLLRGAGR